MPKDSVSVISSVLGVVSHDDIAEIADNNIAITKIVAAILAKENLDMLFILPFNLHLCSRHIEVQTVEGSFTTMYALLYTINFTCL